MQLTADDAVVSPFVDAVDVLSMAQTTNGYIVAVVQPASGAPQLVAYDEADGTLAATADPPAAGAYQLVTLESGRCCSCWCATTTGRSRRRTCRSRPIVFRPLPDFTGFVPDADLDALSERGIPCVITAAIWSLCVSSADLVTVVLDIEIVGDQIDP